MSEYIQIDTHLVAIIASILVCSISLIAVNMRLRTSDPDTHAGLTWVLGANVAIIFSAFGAVSLYRYEGNLAAFIIAISMHLSFVLGYAGVLRGMGHPPPVKWLVAAFSVYISAQLFITMVVQDARTVVMTASVVNGTLAMIFAASLASRAASFSHEVRLLVALPFLLIAAVYVMRIGMVMADMSDMLLNFGVLLTAFVVTFSLITWCFTLQTFGNVRLTQKLALERARAQDANQAKSRFLAQMSHEIRTPLNGVLGMAQVMREQELKAEHLEMATIIQDSGESLLKLLDDILDLSKVEAGKLELENLPFSPFVLIERCAKLQGLRAQEKGVSFVADLAPDLKTECIGDWHRIEQVLNNILNNAVKFTEHGKIELNASLSADEGQADARSLHITVKDSGVGMSFAQISKLFDDYVQATTKTARQYGGSGLGLAISKRLVKLMGGEITVQSDPGEGTTFALRIPLKRAEPDSRLAQTSTRNSFVPPALNVKQDINGMRVLLAEDNRTNQKVVQAMLRHTGVELVIVADGQQAVDMDNAIGRNEMADFHVFLLDVEMPEMNGDTALIHIQENRRRDGRPPAIAIVATANVMAEHLSQYCAAGFVDCLPKPIQKQHLMSLLHRFSPHRQDELTDA